MEDMNFFDAMPSSLNNTLSIGQKRMLQIVQGAIQVFLKVGIEMATYAKIAQASHVSRPLIQHYFPSKKQIIEASFKYLRATLAEVAQDILNTRTIDCKSSKEVLVEYVLMNFDVHFNYTAYPHICFLFFHYAGIDSRLKAQNSYFVRQGTERIKGILERGIADESFNIPSTKVWELAKMIQLIITGAILACATETQENLINIQRNTVNACLTLVNARTELN